VMRLRNFILIITGLVLVIMGCSLQYAHAADVPGQVPVQDHEMCMPGAWKFVSGYSMILRNGVFGPGDHQCITNTGDGANFTVKVSSTPVFNWQAFPSLQYGCWEKLCTVRSPADPLPEPVSSLTRLTERLSGIYPDDGQAGNLADDYWFSSTIHVATTSHPDVAELMVWADWHNVSRDTYGRRMRIGHRTWWVAEYRTTQAGVSWDYIQIAAYRPRPSALAFTNLMPIIRYCETRGWLAPGDIASGFEAGNEMVHGGAGDQITDYRLTF
jgi:hypothetical protein